MNRFKTTCAAIMALTISVTAGSAATCGNTGAGFDAWKVSFAKDAKKAGVKANGLAALASVLSLTQESEFGFPNFCDCARLWHAQRNFIYCHR
mgnify:CR=1 FL=1